VESVEPVTRPATPPQASSQPVQRSTVRQPARTSFLNIGAGYQRGDSDLTRHLVAFKDQYAEEGSIDINYGDGSGVVFEIVWGQRVWRRVSVGLGVSYARHNEAAAVEAHVPHPFFFQTLRDATVSTASLSRQDLALHVPILWTHSFLSAVRITFFGGPSFFHVTQDFDATVTLDEEYLYDQVAITDTSQTQTSDNAVGLHVGADVTRFFNATGVGVGIRYSRASLDFGDETGATTSGRAGGLQITGGVRFRF
jgi:hypothetical protein